jgi:hypothetical protein
LKAFHPFDVEQASSLSSCSYVIDSISYLESIAESKLSIIDLNLVAFSVYNSNKVFFCFTKSLFLLFFTNLASVMFLLF